MKHKLTILFAIMSLLFAACTILQPTSASDAEYAAAQATLDALNRSANNSSSGSEQAEPPNPPPTEPRPTDAPPTDLPPTDVPPTDAPPPTATNSVSRANNLGNTRTIEFDDVEPAWNTNCNYQRQPMSEFGTGWSQDDQLFGSDLGCELAFDLPISTSGLYDVFLAATYAPDFGQLKLSYIGSFASDIINISLYDPSVRPTGEIPLGEWHFDANENTQLVLFVYDKPDASLGYKFGLDYLRLVLLQADS